jgi:biopolymer transport protein ExbD
MVGRDDKQVFLRGDGAVQLQELMDVFGMLKEAGIEKIGVIAMERRAR